MTGNIVIFALLVVVYTGCLIAFLRRAGPYRRISIRMHKISGLAYLLGGLAMIYIAINLAPTPSG